jgi:hypothetical protein
VFACAFPHRGDAVNSLVLARASLAVDAACEASILAGLLTVATILLHTRRPPPMPPTPQSLALNPRSKPCHTPGAGTDGVSRRRALHVRIVNIRISRSRSRSRAVCLVPSCASCHQSLRARHACDFCRQHPQQSQPEAPMVPAALETLHSAACQGVVEIHLNFGRRMNVGRGVGRGGAAYPKVWRDAACLAIFVGEGSSHERDWETARPRATRALDARQLRRCLSAISS